MISSFSWSKQYAHDHVLFFPDNCLRKKQLSHVPQFMERLLEEIKEPVALEFISSYKQSSHVVSEGLTKNGLFFDLAQASIIKNVLFKIAQDYQASNVAKILWESACVYIHRAHPQYAAIMTNQPINPFGEYYAENIPELNAHYHRLNPLRTAFSSSSFLNTVDHFIVAHEVFHLLKHQKKIDLSEVISASNDLFEYAMEQCCYQHNDNFHDIATYHGRIEVSASKLEEIRKDLDKREAYYRKKKKFILEEIQCDAYAYEQVMSHLFDNQPISNIQNIISISLQYLLLFSVFHLHYAINQYVSLSANSTLDGEKPAHVANFLLRAIALGKKMSNYIANKISNEHRKNFRQYFHQELFLTKTAFDSLYTMPVTKIISDNLRHCEQERATTTKTYQALELDYYKLFHIPYIESFFDRSLL